jgi:hypothetical protein
MKNEFVKYEQALSLKELGFDEECIASYDNEGDFKDPFEYNSEETDGYVTNSSLKDPKNFNASSNLALLKDYLDNPFTAAPLYQQAFKFFREKYDILSYIEASPNNTFDYVTVSDDFEEKDYDDGPFKTYEEAEQSCLNKLIEMVKTNNK